jgi:hypothetical protein
MIDQNDSLQRSGNSSANRNGGSGGTSRRTTSDSGAAVMSFSFSPKSDSFSESGGMSSSSGGGVMSYQHGGAGGGVMTTGGQPASGGGVMSYQHGAKGGSSSGDGSFASAMTTGGQPMETGDGVFRGPGGRGRYGGRGLRGGRGFGGRGRRRRGGGGGEGGCGPGGCPGRRPGRRPDGPNGPGEGPGGPRGPRDEDGGNDEPEAPKGPGSRPDKSDPGETKDKDKDKSPDGGSERKPGSGKIDAKRGGEKISNLGDKLQQKDEKGKDYIDNVLSITASNSGFRPGYMDMPGAGALSFFARGLQKAMKGADSLMDAVKNMSKTKYSQGLDAQGKWWHADKVGDEKFKDSAFNVSKNNKDAKNIYLGVSGWGPESTFKRCIDQVGGAMKEKYGAHVEKLYNGKEKDIDKAFEKIAKEAAANPEKAINLVFHVDTHGNNYGKGTKEGSGRGSTLNISEDKLKDLLAKHFKDKKNVGIHLMMSACYAGGYLA